MKTINAYNDGLKITTDPMRLFYSTVTGFTDSELDDAFYQLTADPEQDRLILESARLNEVDDEYCPGTVEEYVEMILEAVRVRKFSQTERTMKALQRVLNRHLADESIDALDPVVGKPKKSGLFSYVTVQFPLSDGQTITIVFHSPDNDAKKITANDEIIAYRWMLNKRDITHLVSPENDMEVTLQEVGKRVSQITAKNAPTFAKRQANLKAQRGRLEEVQKEYTAADELKDQLTQAITGAEEQSTNLDGEIELANGRLANVRDLNAGLEQEIAQLKAAIEEARQRAENNRLADESRRLQQLGTDQVSGIRPQEAEEAGRMWDMLQQGQISQAEWDKYVADLKSEGKVEVPKVAIKDLGDAVVRMSRADYEATYTDPNDPHYPYYIRSLLEDKKWENPAQLMSEFLRLYKMSAPDAREFLRIGLAYAIEDLDAYKSAGPDSPLKQIKNKVVNSSTFTDVTGLIADISRNGYKEPEPEPEPVQPEPEPEPVEPNPEPAEEDTEPDIVGQLRDVVAGSFTDPDAVDSLLDQAAEELEEKGLIDQYEDLLNEVADYLTMMFEKEAA
jgi:Defence against restriction A N-terminal